MSTPISRNTLFKTGILVFLLTTVLAVYWQVGSHAFLKYDDQAYVVDNPHINSGLTLVNIQWAFTSVYAANWHPFTWLSHMLDVQLFGMNPAGHHLVNVFLHVTNAILLFFLLCRSTGSLWRSAVVAALFALHPLHVESVAWVAERKDVLSTLFGLLTLYFYVGYVEQPSPQRYAGMLIAFIFGLMSKPMLVTLPLVMLMMDYWPLNRFEHGCDTDCTAPGKLPFHHLFIEKAPFVLLIAASSAITMYAQQRGRAISTLIESPLSERASNALVSYVGYLGKMLWPHNLSVFYPFPVGIPLWQPLCAFGLLSAITALVILKRRRYPYLIVGWFWYLCTLVPVIGFVRIGLQAMADRYSYIPLIGIFIMCVWGVSDLVNRVKFRRMVLPFLTAVILTACWLVTWHQLSYWHTTTTLFTHAKESTRNNYMAYYVLGGQLEKEGRLEEALDNFNESVKIAPWYEYARIQRDITMFNQGKLDAAAVKYNEAFLQNPDSLSDRISLGIVMAIQGKLEEAVRNFRIALDYNPLSGEAHYNLALTLGRLGRLGEAEDHYRKTLEIEPDDVNALNNLGVTIANQGRMDEAIKSFAAALQRKPDFMDARNNLELARKKQNALLTNQLSTGKVKL